MDVNISDIGISGLNPRKEFDEDYLNELAECYRRGDPLPDLLLRPKGEGSYELVLGECRLKAATIAGKTVINVKIREIADSEMLRLMLAENIHRKDLKPLEEAWAIRTLMKEQKLTQQDLAKEFHKSQAWVSERLALLVLPDEIQASIEAGVLKASHIKLIKPVMRSRDVMASLASKLKEPSVLVEGQDGAEEEDEDPDKEPDVALPDDIHANVLDQVINQLVSNKAQDIEFYDAVADEIADEADVDDIDVEMIAAEIEQEEKACKACGDFREGEKHGTWQDSHKCLNDECYEGKVQGLVEVLRKKFEEQEKPVKEPEVNNADAVDPSNLNWTKYERFYNSKQPWKECKGCAKWKPEKGKKGHFLCLDPACHKRHKSKKEKEERQQENIARAKLRVEVIDPFVDEVAIQPALGRLLCFLYLTHSGDANRTYANLKKAFPSYAPPKGLPRHEWRIDDNLKKFCQVEPLDAVIKFTLTNYLTHQWEGNWKQTPELKKDAEKDMDRFRTLLGLQTKPTQKSGKRGPGKKKGTKAKKSEPEGEDSKGPVEEAPEPAPAIVKEAPTPGICQVCGCTETTPCHTLTGPCAWANKERTLCTACTGKPRKKRGSKDSQ